MGKYINELRRKTTNETLAKRAKGLLKKWRGQVLPSTVSNGSTPAKVARVVPASVPHHHHPSPITAATINNAVNNKKRPLSSLSIDDSSNTSSNKRAKLNGSTELLYISDNSNSCDVKNKQNCNPLKDIALTFTGRVSTSVEPEPPPQPPEQKKRGRKKGSKNHKTLQVQAEESFTNKMAVSVNAKVKTTQELLASIQNKSLSSIRSSSIAPVGKLKETIKIESPKIKIQPESDDEIIEIIDPVKVEDESVIDKVKEELVEKVKEEDVEDDDDEPKKEESVEDILRKLPKVDYDRLDSSDLGIPECSCIEPEPRNITIAFEEPSKSSIFDVPESQSVESVDRTSNIVTEAYIDPDCPASAYYQRKYHLGDEYVTDLRVNEFHSKYLNEINGNKCDKTVNQRICDSNAKAAENGLYSNIVPNFYENLIKDINLNKTVAEVERTIKCCDVDPYLPSESSLIDNQTIPSTILCDKTILNNDGEEQLDHDNFREFHQCVSLRSYNDELLHILPYVVID